MADGDQEDEGDERLAELSSVAAIFPELAVDLQSGASTNTIKANLVIEVRPGQDVTIRTPSSTERLKSTSCAPAYTSHASYPNEINIVSFLPPLTLEVALPRDYPTRQAPLVKLSSQEPWLDQDIVTELEKSIHKLWEDAGRDQVVYTYIDSLQESAHGFFGLDSILEVSSDLKIALLDYDSKAKRAYFESGTYDCGVCLEPKKGTICHRLSQCSHVFCVPCLQDFYNSCISEGDIGNVKCLAPNCKGHSSVQSAEKPDILPQDDSCTLEPSELLQIPLDHALVQRYIKLRRKKQLESDKTTIYCPRQWCQGPARTASGNKTITSDSGNGVTKTLPAPADRLAICEDCSFAFCSICHASWHGEYVSCWPRSQFELNAEDRASEEYMRLHTQPCPTCDARAQKSHGCNHMICFKCDTHFCYLCGSYLERGNPYQHFNNPHKGCYMRLWELEAGDGGEGGGQHWLGGNGAFDDEDEVSSDDDDDDVDNGQNNMEAQQVQHQVAVPAAANNPARPPRPRRVAPAQRRPPAPAVQEGAALRRFLEMVRDDVEDEWDSDEMSGEEDDLGRLGG